MNPFGHRLAPLRQALAAPLLLAVAAQNLGNLLLHAILGRSLGPASYGELGTLLALLTLLTVPLASVQAAASAAAVGEVRSRGDARRLMRVSAWAAVVMMGCLALSPVAIQTLHLSSAFDAALLAPFVAVSIVLAVLRGRLLGHRRVGATAATFLLSIGLRLVLTVLLLEALGITGALIATLAGELAATALAAVLVLRRPVEALEAAPWLRGGDLARNAAALTGLFLFTTLDLFMARALLAPETAGMYVAAATLGKTLLALPAAALSAAYPRLVAAGRGPRRRPEILRSGIVVVGTAIVAGAVVALLPGTVLSLMFGSEFAGGETLVTALALIAAFSSLVSLMTYAQMAVASPLALVPWIGAAIEGGVVLLAHDSALAVARGAAVALAVTVLAMAIPLARSLMSTGRTPTASQSQESRVTVSA